MKPRFIALALVGLSLAMTLGLGIPLATHAQVDEPSDPVAGASAVAPTATPPQVTVYLKNHWPEYNLATSDFLAGQFDDPDSPAYGLVGYTVVTTALTQEALAGKAALVIDESADMSLTAGEAAIIHNFVNGGGRVGLFTFPRHYWDHEGANPSAYQAVADIFGNARIGEPDRSELDSGESSSSGPVARAGRISFNRPYTLTGQIIGSFDQVPFSPITSDGTVAVLVSPALSRAPVAVANKHGILVTNAIGDLVQGGDASKTYREFVANAIVWLADGSPLFLQGSYLPLILDHDE